MGEKKNSIAEISALLLNKTIVEMRKTVQQCRVRCSRKIIHQLNVLKRKKGNEQQLEKNKRKIDRLLIEAHEIKKIKSDDATKFSLINTKTLVELLATTPTPPQAALYKLALCEPLTKKVDEFREKYPKWPIEIPFILQRLGLQYRSKKKKIKPISSKVENADQSTKVDGKDVQEDCSLSLEIAPTVPVVENDENKDDQKAGSSNDEDKTVVVVKAKKKPAKPKKGGLRKNTEKENRPSKPEAPPIEKVTLKEGKIGQMEVRRLKLDEIFGDEIISTDNSTIVQSAPIKKKHHNDGHLKHDPFFADVNDNDEFESRHGSIQDDNDVDIDLLLEDDNDAKSSKKPDTHQKINSLKTKFSSSLKMGADDVREAFPKVKRSEAPNKRYQKDLKNANLIPIGKPAKPEAMTGNRKIRRMKLKQEAEKQAELANLHPSWQAKKKLNNPILLPSTGKKIKFSDD